MSEDATSSTIRGPTMNDKAFPMNEPATAMAVDVVRWLLGNHVADNSTPPDSGTGAISPDKDWPTHINTVLIVQFPAVGTHLNVAPKN